MKSAKIYYYVALLLVCCVSWAQAEDFLPPDQAFASQVQFDDEQSQLQAQWDIAPGYYLYRNRVQLSVNGQSQPISFVTSSQLKEDPYFGPTEVFHDQLTITSPIPAGTASPYDVALVYQGCAEAGLCYSPQTKRLSFTPTNAPATVVTTELSAADNSAAVRPENTANASGLAQWMADANRFWMLATFFVLGLGLTFTPCVLPMIPILAGIIAGQGESLSVRKGVSLSLAYVLGMATTYSLAGILVGFFGARLNLQSALQNPIALSVFAAIFVALSLAMFGFYELQAPAFIRNRLGQVDTGGAKGGLARYGSVALMGLISALVVSPCVSAPLAGALVYISTTGDAWLGGGALFMLSLGMGAPLLLVGAGGGRLLPKAGMWMIAVKQFFGVVLLGIAISLVSRFIPAALSLALWGLLILIYAAQLGLGGELNTGWQKTRRGIAAAMGLYSGALLIGALAGHGDPLQPLAGLNSPAVAGQTQTAKAELFERTADVAALNQQLAVAQRAGQVVVLDLYADWCTACKDMEKSVFAHESGNYDGQVRFLQLDITRNSPEQVAFLNDHHLFGPPALLYFSADGEENDALRTLGEIDFQQWRAQLSQLMSNGSQPL
ncbi:protein-disulfide reductase DsbD [Saccharospirillum sp. HFRX-1]|uniref:protein-disulfide reductase DsbD n=1 Tax=unclassified Saccharospirillum TaxID=2633430 RepID=UPI003717E9C8